MQFIIQELLNFFILIFIIESIKCLVSIRFICSLLLHRKTSVKEKIQIYFCLNWNSLIFKQLRPGTWNLCQNLSFPPSRESVPTKNRIT
jgi:hypothetical protein